MLPKLLILWLLIVSSCCLYMPAYETKNYKVGIEYEHSLPMKGGSDRYRHRNNYDPFFITVTATVKKNYVIAYLEVSATVDALGEVEFCLLSGKAGSRSMTFQLVTNHTDFLSYNYLAYGIKEDEYTKISNIITIPMPSSGNSKNTS